MRYLISEVLDTVNTALLRTACPIRKILAMLGIVPTSYYSWLTPHAMDGRFNPFALRDEEWLIVGFKMKHPNLGFGEIAYVSPSTMYAVLRRYGLVTTRKERIFLSKERYHPVRPDEIWQCDIMYVKVKGRLFCLIVFIDVFSRYITHHALLRSMDADSAGLEAQKAIETMRKDSLAEP